VPLRTLFLNLPSFENFDGGGQNGPIFLTVFEVKKEISVDIEGSRAGGLSNFAQEFCRLRRSCNGEDFVTGPA
jgi:hypothetical protein